MVNLITVFLASPGDVQPEREVVSSCIQQWNQIYGFQRSVYFELLKWETSIAAGFGSDGQDVINQQLPNYDLFIGILWTRLGTQTARSASGTAEEYERALERHRVDSNVEIAFYFKRSAMDPSSLDLDQLKSVRDFEKRIQAEGSLSKIFNSDDTLRYEINLLLDRVARNFKLTIEKPNISSSNSMENTHKFKNEVHDDEVYEDIGLIDISENIERYSYVSTKIMEGITEHINDLASNMTYSTSKLADITKVRQPTHEELKPIISEVSINMDKLSAFLEKSIPEFSENSMSMASNVRDLVRVSHDFIDDEGSLSSAMKLKSDLQSLVEAIESSGRQMLDFRDTVSKLQRMTVSFNKSKRRLVSNLDNLFDAQNSIRLITSQSIEEIDRLIAN